MITGPTAAALAGGRDRFNALFAAARQGDHSLDGERLAAHLATRVQPVVEAAEQVSPGCAPAVTEALYEASLDLLVHGLLGTERGAVLDGVWGTVLPAAARQLATDPRRLAAALCNGMLRVASTPGGRTGQWAALVAGAAAVASDVPALLDAGLVAAWRAGLACAREAALDRLTHLPPEVGAAALGEPAIDAGVVARLAAHRWWQPGPEGAGTVRVVGRVGSFRGFGGDFLTPPRITGERRGAFLVEGGTGPFLLHADAFGATLQRAPGEPPAPIEPGPVGTAAFTFDPGGSVTSNADPAGGVHIAGLENATSCIASSDTLAVTTANSHAVVLMALVPA